MTELLTHYIHTHTHIHICLHIHTHTHTTPMEYYSGIKKNKILSIIIIIIMWIDVEGIVPSEISQAKEDKYSMVSLIYRILKKNPHKQIHIAKHKNLQRTN